MAVVTRPTFSSSTDLTFTGTSLASDTNLLAGRESTSFVNSGPVFDYSINGVIRVGTSPTVGKRIEIWPIAKQRRASDVWPGGFAGTDANKSATSRNVLFSICPRGPIWVAIVDNTTDRDYFINNVSLTDYFKGFVPGEVSLFVVHDTAVALNSTAAQHVLSVTGMYATST